MIPFPSSMWRSHRSSHLCMSRWKLRIAHQEIESQARIDVDGRVARPACTIRCMMSVRCGLLSCRTRSEQSVWQSVTHRIEVLTAQFLILVGCSLAFQSS
jgi:hypothetical protein